MHPHHRTAFGSGHRTRDPLQIPINLSFNEEPRPRILEVTRDLALWLGVVCGAALAVFLIGASVPELNAAAQDGHAAQAVVHTASAAQCAGHY